jgi:hypothetical protein
MYGVITTYMPLCGSKCYVTRVKEVEERIQQKIYCHSVTEYSALDLKYKRGPTTQYKWE